MPKRRWDETAEVPRGDYNVPCPTIDQRAEDYASQIRNILIKYEQYWHGDKTGRAKKLKMLADKATEWIMPWKKGDDPFVWRLVNTNSDMFKDSLMLIDGAGAEEVHTDRIAYIRTIRDIGRLCGESINQSAWLSWTELVSKNQL